MNEFFAKTALLGWLWRRVQELASWGAGLAPLYMSLPKTYQDLIMGILSGKGGGYTISVYLGFAYYIFTQVQSYRATTQPQVVTEDGKKVATKKLSEQTVAKVEREAATVVKHEPSILDKLFGR